MIFFINIFKEKSTQIIKRNFKISKYCSAFLALHHFSMGETKCQIIQLGGMDKFNFFFF